MNTYTLEQKRCELNDTGKDIDTGEQIFEIETRPILYHEVSVWGGSGRRGQTIKPICACYDYGEGMLSAELRDGDTIIACVPATPGSYCVFAYACRDTDKNTPPEVCLGAVVAGDRNAPDTFNEHQWFKYATTYALQYEW